MKEIADRYRGKITESGHELRVDERNGEIIIWYLFWGEYQGVEDHHHMGIARIRRERDQFVVDFLRGIDQHPHTTRRYPSTDGLFADLDEEIASR